MKRLLLAALAATALSTCSFAEVATFYGDRFPNTQDNYTVTPSTCKGFAVDLSSLSVKGYWNLCNDGTAGDVYVSSFAYSSNAIVTDASAILNHPAMFPIKPGQTITRWLSSQIFAISTCTTAGRLKATRDRWVR